MLIRSEQLTLNEASDILDESVYLEECESLLNPVSVPVLENTRLGICTVNYNDIYRICEDYCCFPDEALEAVAESSGIDPDYIAVAIDEADIILDPSIADEFDAYVINPISENCTEYLLTESALELFLEGDEDGYLDESYLDILVYGIDEDYGYLNEIGAKLDSSSNPNFFGKKGKMNKAGKDELQKRRDAMRQKVFEKRLSRFLANSPTDLKKYMSDELEKLRNTDSYKNMSDADKKKAETSLKSNIISERKKGMVSVRKVTGKDSEGNKTYGGSRAFNRSERDIASLNRMSKNKDGKEKTFDVYGTRNIDYKRDKNGNIELDSNGNPTPVSTNRSSKASMTLQQIMAAKKGGATFSARGGGGLNMTAPENTNDTALEKEYDRTPLGVTKAQTKRYKFKKLSTAAPATEGVPPKVQEEIKKAENTNDPGRISKIVASLRNFYKNFLQKANQEHDQQKISWYKNIARVILNYIDKLLAKLDKTKQEG